MTESFWEATKENIKPLKTGRSPNVIHPCGTGLKLQPTFYNGNEEAYQEMLKQRMDVESQRRWFEEKIRLEDTEDPLEYWYRYIKWIEQTFPSGREKDIRTLSTKCLKLLPDKERYRNDIRWWYILFKVASTSRRLGSLSLYQSMYDTDQCTELAAFYKQWGYELEQAENFKEAKRVYLLGIEAKAQPSSELESALLNLELQVAKRLATSESNEDQYDEPTRNIFGILKGIGKNNSAPAVRHSTTEKVKLASGIQESRNSKPSSHANFIIPRTETKNDEKRKVGHPKLDEFFRNPVDCPNENMSDPAAWTKQKIKALGKGRGATGTPQNPFMVYAEEAADSAVNKTPAAFPNGALKTINSDAQAEEPALDFMTNQKKDTSGRMGAKVESSKDSKEIRAYDSRAVYGGLTEMSFEEIHAAIWIAKYRSRMAPYFEQEDRMEETACITSSIQAASGPSCPSDFKRPLPVSVASLQQNQRVAPNARNSPYLTNNFGASSAKIDRYKSVQQSYEQLYEDVPSSVASVAKADRLLQQMPMGQSSSQEYVADYRLHGASGAKTDRSTSRGDQSTSSAVRPLHGNSSFTAKLNSDVMALFNRTTPWLRQTAAGDVDLSPPTSSASDGRQLVTDDDNGTGYLVQRPVVASFKIYDENLDSNCVGAINLENKENIPPSGCIFASNKRNVNGILSSSLEHNRANRIDSGIMAMPSNDTNHITKMMEKSKLDESDYTVAGSMKPLLGERAVSTPCRTLGPAQMPSFSLLCDDENALEYVQSIMPPLAYESAKRQASFGAESAVCVKQTAEKVTCDACDGSRIEKKLSTIAEETSRDFRSCSSSSGSSGGSSHGVSSLVGSVMRKRFPSSSHLHTMSTIAEQQQQSYFSTENLVAKKSLIQYDGKECVSRFELTKDPLSYG